MKKETLSDTFKYIVDEMYSVEEKNNCYQYIIYSHMVNPLFSVLKKLNISLSEFKDEAGLSDYQLKKIKKGLIEVKEYDMFSYGEPITFKTKKGEPDKMTPFLEKIIFDLKKISA